VSTVVDCPGPCRLCNLIPHTQIHVRHASIRTAVGKKRMRKGDEIQWNSVQIISSCQKCSCGHSETVKYTSNFLKADNQLAYELDMMSYGLSPTYVGDYILQK
jgi:hypothetical protein